MGPFVKSTNTTDKIMKNLVIALIPIILFTFYKNGIVPFINDKTDIIGLFYPLLFILISTLTTFITELIYTKLSKKNSYYSYIPGIFIALVLPINTPIYVLMIAGIIGTLVGKMIYGGFGHNIFNPALIGCLFVMTIYSGVITNNGGYLNRYEIDTIGGATPLSTVTEGIGTYDELIKPYGNLLDFFIGTIPGSVGETSAILCLIGLAYLIIKKVIKPQIPLFYIGTVFVLTAIIGTNNGVGLWYPLYQILSGGLLFGAVFMATDPVTSPTSKLGSSLYGVLLGVGTVLIRYLTNYPEGVMTSILIMNLFVPLLDRIGIRNKKYTKKLIISILIILLLGTITIVKINDSLKVKEINTDFKVISITETNNIKEYIATQKGFKGDIKASVKIKDNKIIEYTILECKDDYLNIVEDADYINKLVSSKDVKEVDTVSGATRTSTALKNLLINVLEDNKK